jgi:hypothetical protein
MRVAVEKEEAVTPLRLRFEVRRPNGARDTRRLSPARGRNLNLRPLLVALDAICLREDQDHIPRVTLKRGRPRRNNRGTTRDDFLELLARRWSISPATADAYVSRDERFYYPRALSLVRGLTGPEFKFTLDDVRRAVEEHLPARRHGMRQPLVPGAILLNLYPVLRTPKLST